jgi:hypothetical protein
MRQQNPVRVPALWRDRVRKLFLAQFPKSLILKTHKRTRRREAQLETPSGQLVCSPQVANALADIYERLLKRRAERLAREAASE